MSSHALLTAEDHRTLRIRTDRGAAFGDAVMTCLTVPDEFRRVQACYPILFRQGVDREGFSALALFGFENGENLFLDGNGWDAPYIPLAMDIQPFLIGRPAQPDGEAQVHVDLASPRIAADEGVRVFDELGRPTPYVEAIADKLGALHAGYEESGAFFEALARHELLEPLTLEVTLEDGATNRLVGFHIIDEDRLRALDAGVTAELHAEGHLMPIFMALASLAQLNGLIARKNAAVRGG
ncbi:SapC family protein [Sphingomonas aracearum]|uniref:Multidrug transporter n=1 Tax=Sphingomonas aracearum TaxID=2283317 RepID=A0A369VXZ7_9SPHN|nr:SapC family protein [Sphingomonas aracearum]RDE07264.1 multidrug transporter [Sphingomonas aracearum]